ncbi:GNAT family N-acetyltransferase [Paenibacillus dakarensis]|uniref:GNAT family N-acetyltransferase n=1 Tax=Paenibacillus dakarensis TaxID=1527293 RepID=UPI0006D598B2|nr:GNAT family N-acetyltransferase [Paenibacillus dakarensis]
MIIREFENYDIHQMVKLYFSTVHSVNKKDYTKEQLEAWAPVEEQEQIIEGWLTSFHLNNTYVAVYDGEIVGFSDMTRTGYLDRLYVHKDYQRRGIAKALVEKLEREAMNLGLTEIKTEASITAKPFFKHLGYEVIRQQTVIRRGTELTNFLMIKRITC